MQYITMFKEVQNQITYKKNERLSRKMYNNIRME